MRARIIGSLLLFLSVQVAAVPSAHAAVAGLTPTPTSANVPLGRSTAVTILWRANVSLTPPDTLPVSVFSTQGIFVGLGTTINTRLSKTVASIPAVAPAVVSIPETVIIPEGVIFRAYKLGSATLSYSRTFQTPSGASSTASVTLNIVSSGAAGFAVSRIALSFDDRSQVRVVSRNDSLQSVAEINFNGTGLLEGAWEIAGPASIAGQPIFRPLRTVRQNLGAGNVQVLRSPVLPSNAAGLYLVRFRITSPATGFTDPVIRYFVSRGDAGPQASMKTITLAGPPDRTPITSDTAFQWHPISDSVVYQLEIYAAAEEPYGGLPDLGGETVVPKLKRAALSEPPITGMLVPGRQTHVALSAAAKGHLVSGRTYFWRVRALDADGVFIGASALREFRVP